jgi:murein L,D-transpeptidase YafK
MLSTGFAIHNAALGAPIYIRIFKEERELELWVQTPSDTYALFKTYPICNHSGGLGPKLKEGDRQSPEGFYTVTKSALNPNSSYHLSFNLGFPNRFDRSHNRTGSVLMVHATASPLGVTR